MHKVFRNMDWKLLRKQKAELLKIIEDIDNVKQLERLEGLIVFLDHFQDTAADEPGLSERVVFGKKYKACCSKK
jgi:hypothetical protein